MRKKLKELRRKIKRQLSCLKRRFVEPPLPKNPDGEVLVHIGCGEKNAPGFINVDARPLAHVHVVTDDITSLADFETGTVDLVYMCHILEHIKRDDLRKVLSEMKRVLKDGGVLRISVPDFDKLIEVYDAAGKDIDAISRQLMGGQDHQYNVHYSVFNRQRLSDLFKDVGFREVSSWDPDNCRHHDFKDRASRRLKVNGKEYMISLNLEAVK
ncbi:MAG TPA: methyltransferase domain-containing protein [Sedimentisphaerales bacterium]|nr:methyltransferase domain-containing protein [Sedimentisphaerales bacterium]